MEKIVPNSGYIKYLNTLHNVGARNENAYAESNQNNPYFHKTIVKRPTGAFIIDKLTNEEPHIIILTGHAGDGKTSLLLQVLDDMGLLNEQELNPFDEIVLPNGKSCLYIKDFSELSEHERESKMKDFLEYPVQDKYVILIANTGPLLNTFEEILGEDAQIKLLNLIDENSGSIEEICGSKIRTINAAGIDNTSFAKPFLENIIEDSLWVQCEQCIKVKNCPIKFNQIIVSQNFAKVSDFLTSHYIWQQEHGKRLTIRQITAHLSFAITGGLECKQVKNIDNGNYLFDFLFTNSIFGYSGFKVNKDASEIQAISDIMNNHYDQKRIVADESIFIKQDYSALPQKLQTLARELGIKSHYSTRWQAAVRRMYYLVNIETDDKVNTKLLKDGFSNSYPRYLELRRGASTNNDDKMLVLDALAMIFIGDTYQSKNSIPLTLKRGSGITQSVQMVHDVVYSRDIKVKTSYSNKCNFDGERRKSELRMEVCGKEITYPIALPLLNYFEDIRNGIVTTNIDPQLSHGIDSIKAQILACCAQSEDGRLELMVMKTNKWETITLNEENDKWKLD